VSERSASFRRESKETQIDVTLSLGAAQGRATIEAPLPFFVHMLDAFARYAGFDLRLTGHGDIEVDAHHFVEDCGIVLGTTVDRALGDRAGIRRFGDAYAPLDEALVRCAVDYSRRPVVVYELPQLQGRINDFDVAVLGEFVRAYAQGAGATIHLDCIRGDNLHHIAEAAFKALGLATREALQVVGGGVPSTKGIL